MKDRDLVAALGRKDWNSARELFDKLFPAIELAWKSLLLRKFGGLWFFSHGPDVIQQAALAMWVTLCRGRFDGNRGVTLLAWSKGILCNKAKDYLKKIGNENARFEKNGIWETTHPAPGASPDQNAAGNERCRKVLQAIYGLPEPQRRVMLLKLDGIRGVDIAVSLGLSTVQVSRISSQAQEALEGKIF